MTLYVFSVGTHSFSGGGCAQSPDPSGRDTRLGWNGVEADLQEGDQCMARYYPGSKWRKAVLIRRSG